MPALTDLSTGLDNRDSSLDLLHRQDGTVAVLGMDSETTGHIQSKMDTQLPQLSEHEEEDEGEDDDEQDEGEEGDTPAIQDAAQSQDTKAGQDKTRKFKCPHCPKAFLRGEHLRRHVGTRM
jgi:hypothetical protein